MLAVMIFLGFISCQDPLENALPDLDVASNTPDHDQPDLSGQMVVTGISGNEIECSWQYFAGTQHGKSPFEVYRISLPNENWNGDLIVYAHGYVSTFGFNLTGPVDPFGFPDDVYQAEQLALSLGYGFAASTFSTQGIAVQNGVQECITLRQWFANHIANTEMAYIVGGSQGGLIATIIAERYPQAFNGALSLCGPCGNFQKQLNHYGDFRLLFEYYFDDVLDQYGVDLGTFEEPNPALQNLALWQPGGSFFNLIALIIQQNPQKIQNLIKVSKAVSDPDNLQTTIMSLLWYHIFTMEDALQKLNGLAYTNARTWYSGTGSFVEDWKLNKSIQRFSGDADALALVAASYETTGHLGIPLVMMHTTGDPIQTFWIQQPVYRLKVLSAGKWPLFSALPINRYGHCNFTPEQMTLGFVALVLKTEGRELLASL